MAALTPSTTIATQRESLGSLTLLIVPLTTTSASDTYTIAAGSPVVDYFVQSQAGSTAGYNYDVTYTLSTGVFLITSGAQGLIKLFILIRT